MSIQEMIRERIVDYLAKIVSDVVGLSREQINAKEKFDVYGIDSVMIMDMTNEMEKDFGDLPKTLFFEYTSINELVDYFVEAQEEKVQELFGPDLSFEEEKDKVEIEKQVENVQNEGIVPNQQLDPTPGKMLRRFMTNSDKKGVTTPIEQKTGNTILSKQHSNSKIEKTIQTKTFHNEEISGDDIAIIGMSGRYPGANNLDDFWEKLCQGKDCITEIPKERWNWEGLYKEDRKGFIDSKWGGFIKDVDKFDPLFFHINYEEALSIDPQERLFLECAYNTLQDAGYTPNSLKKYSGDGLEENVGVFVGVMYQEYHLYNVMGQAKGNQVGISGITSGVANRVSYTFNFHGPSVVVNTMCSSSLLAIHQACQSIRLGDCEMAIAGGVNLSLHPNKYLALSHNQFLSLNGRCKSFGSEGDGYVPGEGVGAILLKPLSKAIQDGDHIYGVVKGSSVNHGGKTNGYTVPNPTAQADVIRRAWKKANISPRNISYIEAHGTGTALGDPIEIRALSKVFEEDTKDKQFCSIGSVKSNIGHLESAAGIASITKVLLQMKYKKLVPSIHSDSLNRNIDFENSPFYVQHRLADWKTARYDEMGELKSCPRIAGISAFGAGGTNVHIVLEEYVEPENETHIRKKQYPILLSGKDKRALENIVSVLFEKLETGIYDEFDLERIAYTLQLGREEMEQRFATVVSSISELKGKLLKFKNGVIAEKSYVGNVKEGKDTIHILSDSQEFRNVFQDFMQKEDYEKLLPLWVKGLQLDWTNLYNERIPQKISLPTYPFAKERFWMPDMVPECQSNVIVTKGNREEGHIAKEILNEISNETIAPVMRDMLFYTKTKFSKVSKIPVELLDEDVQLEEFGIDSIMIKDLTEQLQKDFPMVSVTMFYQFQTIGEIAAYLEIQKMDDVEDILEEVVEETLEEPNYTRLGQNEDTCNDIAIIGMSGRFPGADDVDMFWENLKTGRDCVTEIPKERWNYNDFYDCEKGKQGKLYGKWGGFINDVDKFDPLFFNLSPDHAETIDPMERIFLQSVWTTLEDAGYTKKSLRKYKNLGMEGDVGVFVGATFMEYQFYGVQNQVKGNPIAVTGLPSSIANSVSYHCNFHGPSMTVDTMCSSSLTALHLACESLKRKECQLAVAGGVNLSLHPNKYLFLSQNYFLSSKGRCEAFGNDGDGYVPGEGVVSVLLKPLDKAKEDGDHIYGVIKATAVNHGGKVNGFTVPNLNAQKQVVQMALKQANVNPRTISYMEAHGTGTSLGDPIEITGLTSAYREETKDSGYCSIGSVKSNIGHLEAASGLAALIKVLLQMKYKQLVPSIHCETLNENINFEETPFYVQRKLEPWKRPVISMDKERVEYKRRAGISSFGAGGSNAHIIVEEYEEDIIQKTKSQKDIKLPIVLSAKTKEALKERATQLIKMLEKNTDAEFLDIAYTLQVGRESMEERVGFLASDNIMLKQKLISFVEDKNVEEFLLGYVGKEKRVNSEINNRINLAIGKGDWLDLISIWIEGYEIEWNNLPVYKNKPKRLSLPTYPFEKMRCWIEEFQYENVYEPNQSARQNNLIETKTEDLTLFRERGVYFFINGINNMGEVAVREITSLVNQVDFIIAGQRNDAMEEKIRQIVSKHGNVKFYKYDAKRKSDISNCIALAKKDFKNINGIVLIQDDVRSISKERFLETFDLDFVVSVSEHEVWEEGRLFSKLKEHSHQGTNDVSMKKGEEELHQAVQTKFIQFLAKDLKIDPSRIHPDDEFSSFGIDSIRGMQLIKTLSNDFSRINGEIFLSCHTVEAFSKKLLMDYKEDCINWLNN